MCVGGGENQHRPLHKGEWVGENVAFGFENIFFQIENDFNCSKRFCKKLTDKLERQGDREKERENREKERRQRQRLIRETQRKIQDGDKIIVRDSF